MRYFFITLLVATVLSGCTVGRLRSGDLVFVAADRSEMSKAISSATSDESLDFDHVGIICIDSHGQTGVINAVPKSGVVCTPWSEFQKEAAGITVMRMTDRRCDVGKAVRKALTLVGQPYDWHFKAGNDSYYCSELVQECYLDSDSVMIFPSEPMNFADTDGNYPKFWIELFESLGVDIPQGEPGTNPNGLAHSPKLKKIKISS